MLVKKLDALSIDDLKSRQVGVDRQLAALKDLLDSRSVASTKALVEEATLIRHSLTLRKPPQQRVHVLIEAISKKKQALTDAQKTREQIQASIDKLKIEILEAETALVKAEKDVVAND
eukprot:9147203-Karenia_brevis.AAC.1